MIRTLIFPSQVVDRKKVDDDMRAEYDAALETGKFEMLLFSYNDWFNKGILKLSQPILFPIKAVYRGWMMKPEQYEGFYSQLLKANIQLVTTPQMYSLMHVFPNIYPYLRDDIRKHREREQNE